MPGNSFFLRSRIVEGIEITAKQNLIIRESQCTLEWQPVTQEDENKQGFAKRKYFRRGSKDQGAQKNKSHGIIYSEN